MNNGFIDLYDSLLILHQSYKLNDINLCRFHQGAPSLGGRFS